MPPVQALDRGRVIGVDIEIRPHNRVAIEAHPLNPFIALIEGSSTAPEIVESVNGQIGADERVLVILDSNHTKAHVLAELAAYGPLVSPDSYIVVADGIMADLSDVPGRPAGLGVGQPERRDLAEFAGAAPALRAGGAGLSIQRRRDRGARHVLALGVPQAASRRVRRSQTLPPSTFVTAVPPQPRFIVFFWEPTSNRGPECCRPSAVGGGLPTFAKTAPPQDRRDAVARYVISAGVSKTARSERSRCAPKNG